MRTGNLLGKDIGISKRRKHNSPQQQMKTVQLIREISIKIMKYPFAFIRLVKIKTSLGPSEGQEVTRM